MDATALDTISANTGAALTANTGAALKGTDIERLIQRNDTWLGRGARSHQQGLASGFRALDEQLYTNGWPLGNSIELLSDGCGIGAMGLFLPAMEALSQQSRWQVFIAPPYIPYAPLLAARGVDVQQVLLVHPQNRQDLLWSVEQALRSTTCSAVFAWLGAGEYRYSELRKLQLAAAGSDVLAVLFRPRQAACNHSPAALRLEMREYRQVHILKQRGGNQDLDVDLGTEDDVPGQPQLWELPAYPPARSDRAPALGA
jgi:protein ImuA